MQDSLDHVPPARQIRSATAEQSELVHDALVESLLVEEQRDLINRRNVAAFNDCAELDVAEESDFPLHFLGERALGAANQNVGLDSDFHQLPHRVLRRLRLHLA